MSQYQGKIWLKSINRCSRSYNEMQSIINNFDSQLEIKKPSGRHSSASWVTDVKDLGKQYTEQYLFRYEPGRSHSQFPSFPQDYLATMDINAFKTWIFKKLTEFKNKNIYNY